MEEDGAERERREEPHVEAVETPFSDATLALDPTPLFTEGHKEIWREMNEARRGQQRDGTQGERGKRALFMGSTRQGEGPHRSGGAAAKPPGPLRQASTQTARAAKKQKTEGGGERRTKDADAPPHENVFNFAH